MHGCSSYCHIRWVSFLAFLLASVALAQPGSSADERDLPPFLAAYYADAIAVLGTDFILTEKENKDDLSRYRYESADRVTSVEFQHFPCERDRCQVSTPMPSAISMRCYHSPPWRRGDGFSAVGRLGLLTTMRSSPKCHRQCCLPRTREARPRYRYRRIFREAFNRRRTTSDTKPRRPWIRSRRVLWTVAAADYARDLLQANQEG